jgi:hypothetical protein
MQKESETVEYTCGYIPKMGLRLDLVLIASMGAVLYTIKHHIERLPSVYFGFCRVIQPESHVEFEPLEGQMRILLIIESESTLDSSSASYPL